MWRMFRIVLLLALMPLSIVWAYEARFAEFSDQFAIETLTDVAQERWLVGELAGFPHTYQFTLTEPTVFDTQVMVYDTYATERPSLIIVREIDRGVETVMRRDAAKETWELFHDPVSGLDFQQSEDFSSELPAGVYRLEVSMPLNEGQYILKLGHESAEGYFAKLANIKSLRNALGLSTIGMLTNGYVWVPMFILISLGFFGWWFGVRNRAMKK